MGECSVKVRRPNRPITPSALGPLEQKMLRLLWRFPHATVREVIRACRSNLAYTTVLTTLNRLYRKGVLTRTVDGRSFRYSPKYTFEQIQQRVVVEVVEELLATAEAPALWLSFLVQAIDQHDPHLLEELSKSIEQRRAKYPR